MTNLDKFKLDLDRLITEGSILERSLSLESLTEESKKKIAASKEGNDTLKKIEGLFRANYQNWYTQASALIKQLIPDRHSEFVSYYLIDSKRKTIEGRNYKIQDWLNGFISGVNQFTGAKHFNDFSIITGYFRSQFAILKACNVRFNSSLMEIKQLLQADLFDSEVDAARELHKKGFLRASGAVCGVVLERHLSQVASSHALKGKKTNPTISDLNDTLRAADIYDLPVWRQIQRLGDIRNMCDHSKGRDPGKEEIEELIDGVDKIIKTIH